MTISNDLLLGMVVGVLVALGFQAMARAGRNLFSPGCLFFIGLGVVMFIVLVFSGAIHIA